MLLAHRIALDPTEEQRIALLRAAGCARFAWNWALAEWDRQHKAGEKPTAFKLKKQFNALKKSAYPWIMESPKDANQQPFTNLGKAFNKFFARQSKRPKFKCRGQHDAFYVSNTTLNVSDRAIRLPVIGRVRIREALRFKGKIMSATVSREADRWFVAIQVQVSDAARQRSGDGAVGIDLGITHALTCSDGQVFDAPKPLKAGLVRLRRLSRSHSRKVKGSKNHAKASMKLARCHRRIKDIRLGWTHKVTTTLCRQNQTVVVEDLNVKGMTANRKLARVLSDVQFAEIRRQLVYKSIRYGGRVVVISRWEPTSKKCSACGNTKDMPLSQRMYHCSCGMSLDRDMNAARNILAAGLAVSACGEEGSDCARKRTVKPASTKQELNPCANSR